MLILSKRWIVVPVIFGLLALGITTGAVLAQGGGDDGDSTSKSLASRVADILGLDEASVQAALQQAVTEARQERWQDRLDRMVDQGVITQEQADEYLQWLESKPEGIPHRRGFFGRGGFGGHGAFGGSNSSGSLWGDHRFGYQFGQPDGGAVGFFGQRPGGTATGEIDYGTY